MHHVVSNKIDLSAIDSVMNQPKPITSVLSNLPSAVRTVLVEDHPLLKNLTESPKFSHW